MPAVTPHPLALALLSPGVNADFLWEEEKVILEVDSWQFHGHRSAFESDRKKDMILRDAGYVVIRVTWRQFTEELLPLIASLARIKIDPCVCC